jgi:hypothetical protein
VRLRPAAIIYVAQCTMSLLKVLYDFTAVEEGELSVKAGETLNRINNPQSTGGAEDDGWVMAESTSGAYRSGFVPAGTHMRNYVRWHYVSSCEMGNSNIAQPRAVVQIT